jgi:hypothetical protein
LADLQVPAFIKAYIISTWDHPGNPKGCLVYGKNNQREMDPIDPISYMTATHCVKTTTFIYQARNYFL